MTDAMDRVLEALLAVFAGARIYSLALRRGIGFILHSHHHRLHHLYS